MNTVTFTIDVVIAGVVVVETLGLTALLLYARWLLRRSRTDQLTGLGNRAALTRAYRSLRFHPGLVGVLLLDLDGFKAVNDRHGHRTGDHLLNAFAARLAAVCRPGEVAVRLHGDEFAVLLGPTGPARAAARRDAITTALADTYPLDGPVLRATASVGVAVVPFTAGLGELLRQADQDMYATKRVRHVAVGGNPLSRCSMSAQRHETRSGRRAALDQGRSRGTRYRRSPGARVTGSRETRTETPVKDQRSAGWPAGR